MSLKTLETIRAALAARPDELSAAKAAGRKVVGWLNYNVPEEIIHALGLIPVRLGSGGDDRLVELGSRYISTGNCVYVRQTTGLFAENTDPYVKSIDLLAVDVTCKQIYRVAEVVKHYFKINSLILGVPYNFNHEAGQEYFRREVAAFTGKLEEFAGHKLDAARLAESVRLFADIRVAISQLYALQAEDVPKITWQEVLEVVQAGNFLDRQQYLLLLEELLAELAQSEAPSANHKLAGLPRLLLSGSIIPPKDRKLINIIEQLGGRIVIDDLWSGYAPALTIKVKQPELGAIADAYLIPHASLPTLDFEGDQRLKNLKTLVRDFKVQGVVYHTLRYCDAFTFKANETKQVLQGEGVPFLEIHTEYAGSDFEAIRTRVEAFIELVRNKHAEFA